MEHTDLLAALIPPQIGVFAHEGCQSGSIQPSRCLRVAPLDFERSRGVLYGDVESEFRLSREHAVNHDKSLARIHREFRMVSKIFNMTGLLGSGQLVAVPDG